MIIIFGALKIELENIIRGTMVHRTIKKHGIAIYSGLIDKRDVLVAVTGIGRHNAAKAADIVCGLSEVNEAREVKVLITGFCGAAAKRLEIGDLVVYNRVTDCTKNSDPIKDGDLLPPADYILSTAKRVLEIDKIRNVVCGCTGRVVSTPEEKAATGKKYGVDVIDMETYWIIEQLQKNGLPPGLIYCIRAVSDDSSVRLPVYFSSDTKPGAVLKFLRSILISIFSKDEFRINLNALRNIGRAKSRLDKTVLRFIQ
ncbi:MAG: hypothetical protein MUP02_07730 [Actinobacteria bacterium]|nr:hypothetical protein [Actinomycetota bacterium]